MSDFLKNIAVGLIALACVVAVIGGGLYLMTHYPKWTAIVVLGGWGLWFLHAWGKELRWTWKAAMTLPATSGSDDECLSAENPRL